MIQVSRADIDALRKVGLLKEGRDRNYTVINRKKKSRRKKYCVVDEPKILAFLNRKKEY